MGREREPDRWHERSLERRRERIVQAMVHVVCERNGFADVLVTAVCARAGLSRRLFYDTFDSRESCFLAALDVGYSRAYQAVADGFAGADFWLDGVRLALAELLVLFDTEPQLARVCIVESLAAGPWALQRREQHVAKLTRVIVSHWGTLAPREPHPFANEGVVASVLGIIQSHLFAKRSEPLSALLGPLMGLAVAPYLDANAVAAEVERSGDLARELLARRSRAASQRQTDEAELPGLLLDPRAHRARECVLYLAEHPGASNSEVARALGIVSHTQISTLLAQLARLGLAYKKPTRRGHPNAWSLNRESRHMALVLAQSHDHEQPAVDERASQACETQRHISVTS
jgi:AcrR family transcriptional regulator